MKKHATKKKVSKPKGQKTVLVTGGTGYIGSHTVIELQEKGYDVIIADNLSNSDRSVVERIEKITKIKPKFYEIDLRDKPAVEKLFRENDIDATIHFAALKAVNESLQKPLEYYENNLLSLIHVMEQMRYKSRALVFSSSCTVYGDPKKFPVNEKAPIRPPMSPYGNTKQIGEEIIRDSVDAYPEMRAISLRYFNPIGAHPSALIGEDPRGVPLNLMPYITQTAAGIREELSVFGKDYNTKDGTCVRDYIHVVDLAKAHVKAVERIFSHKMKSRYEIFNLGTGTGYSVLDVINSFEKMTDIKLDYTIAPRREGDVEMIWADPSYANKELGWEAEQDLDSMTLSAWEWQRALEKNNNTNKPKR